MTRTLVVQCQHWPLLLLCCTTASSSAASAGESPHWHAGSDSELWSTGTLSLGTLSSLFSSPLLSPCLSTSFRPRAAVTISAVRVLERLLD